MIDPQVHGRIGPGRPAGAGGHFRPRAQRCDLPQTAGHGAPRVRPPGTVAKHANKIRSRGVLGAMCVNLPIGGARPPSRFVFSGRQLPRAGSAPQHSPRPAKCEVVLWLITTGGGAVLADTWLLCRAFDAYMASTYGGHTHAQKKNISYQQKGGQRRGGTSS